MNCSYTSIEISKTGLKVPLKNTLCLCSKYDPEKEAEVFASQFKENDLYFVIAGICGGYHIKKLLEINPERRILAVENTEDDFNYLSQIECCSSLLQNPQVIKCTVKTLFNTIINTYLPAVYGNLNFAYLRGFENAFPEELRLIKQLAETAIKTVKADFSVQTRFGKIWQKNIFENLSLARPAAGAEIFERLKKNSTKTAAVIAAGPSLDKSIEELKDKTKNFFIISTDTAYSTLIKSDIIPDIVVSLDAQMISHAHFLHTKQDDKKTVFMMDLCSNSAVSKKLLKKRKDLMFFESGHPLCVTASKLSGNSFIHLNSGAGTVTIACADLASKLGFKNTEFFGADFAYINGKPYAKGTYLDEIYGKNSDCINSIEKNFLKLMFRTELIKTDKGVTTSVMESYKKSFNYFLEEKKVPFREDLTSFDFNKFKAVLKTQLLSLDKNCVKCLSSPAFYTLLPLMAFYEQTKSRDEAYELARSKTLRYT